MPDSAAENAPTPRARFRKLIDSFEAYVQAEKEKGADTVPATPALVAALAAPIPPPPARKTRLPTAPGPDHPHPDLMFLRGAPDATGGEPPAADVNAADQLLTKMIEAMGYRRSEVIITDLENSQPSKLKPKVIVTLGTAALKHLMGPKTDSLTNLRGRWQTHQGTSVMPTFHPADLLHSKAAKTEAWSDLKAVLTKLGRTPPPMKK